MCEKMMNEKIEAAIRAHVKNHKAQKGTRWRSPVIGFADAQNPRFAQLKHIVGPSHATPFDLLADAKSVVCFFLPFSEEIIKSNLGGIQSSRAWDLANIETNLLIGELSLLLHELSQKEGCDSTLLPATYNYDEKLLRSDWSHRHVAYIAGLGSFGIHNLLITEAGCCGRIGSVVTSLPLVASKVKTGENCLFKHNGSCAKCVQNCVANAISSTQGYPYVDRSLCNKQVYDDCVPEYDIGMGDACGKCMVGVPCSLKNPCAKLQAKAL